MMWYRWLMHLLDGLVMTSSLPAPVRIGGGSVRTVFTRRHLLGLTLSACSLTLVPSLTWASDSPSVMSTGSRPVVAAGFGFQNADSSTITVKTYDAETGEILSDDTYELDVKDEGPVNTHQVRERIFAGGVGVGSEGLSEFNLRVYDAATGQFLWQGHLNLSGGGHGEDVTVPIAARVQPRALVQRTAQRTAVDHQPYFFIRAVSVETGRLLWSDQFSADADALHVERISRGIVGLEPVAPRDVDFRIRMFDESTRRMLWEDQVVSESKTDEAPASRQEEAGLLPGWTTMIGGTAAKESI